jgi:hypothetical protein
MIKGNTQQSHYKIYCQIVGREGKSIPLTYIYITVHFPGFVQAPE